MPRPVWYPHLTVAAIIEDQGRFLCVEEHPRHRNVINQPAGHVDPGESIVAAIRREVREETGYLFEPEKIVGLYYFLGSNQVSYMRICFHGAISGQVNEGPIDPDISQIHWFTPAQLKQQKLRSPVVIDCLEDYLADKSYPLELLNEPPYQRTPPRGE